MSSAPATPAAVLFDLDGVIVDSRDFHMLAWKRWAAEHHITHPAGYFHDMFGRRNDAIIGGLLTGIDSADLAQLAASKEQLFRDAAKGQLVALPGVTALLEHLDRNHLPRAIVTSTPRANLDMILDDLGLFGRFHALVAEEDASKGKPDPEGFLVGAQRLDVSAKDCIVIEDAPAGLRAAIAGGMRAIGVTTTHPSPALSDAGASLIVDSLADPAVAAFILGD